VPASCAHRQPLIEGADDEYIINSITIVSFNSGHNLGNFKKKLGDPYEPPKTKLFSPLFQRTLEKRAALKRMD
jgi:hypothetical protein